MWFNVYVKNINPERSMVAARKPWDAPGLKQYQMGNNWKVSRQNPERFMVATRKPWDAPGLKLLQKIYIEIKYNRNKCRN